MILSTGTHSPMRLSKKVEYGIVAIVHLTQRARKGRNYLQSREIAEHEHLPGKFLESILLALKSGGILESKVGAGGGYRLIRDPHELLLAEVIAALETPAASEQEFVATGAEDAPGREALSLVNDRIDDAFRTAVGSLTLAELMALVADRVPAGR